ncbi:glycosyltransferase family 4 protein [Oceanisphaera sediminis]
MKRTVWYISKYFSCPSVTSPGSRGFSLLEGMAKKNIQPIAIVSDSNNVAEVPELYKTVTHQELNGVKLVWLKTMRYGAAKSLSRVLSWFHFEWNLLFLNKKNIANPDVIIVSSLSLLTIFNGLILKRKYKCKLVFEVRDIWPLSITEEGGFSNCNPFVMLLAFAERLGYKYADAVVGTMPNLGEHVKQVLGYERTVDCIPMGAYEELFDPAHEPLPDCYVKKHLPLDKFLVVYSGTVGITNNLDVFFQCAKKLESNSAIHFVVLGSGSLLDYYIDKYSALSNLSFAPRVKKNQVLSVLQYADLLYFSVYPSKVWDYGQSLNKVIDYMAAGKPIVASYSGHPSMIDEAGCGVFVPAGDIDLLAAEIVRFSEMPNNERIAMGSQGKTWLAEHRTYTKLADDYINILFPELIAKND